MAGKMTILDRLAKSGRIQPGFKAYRQTPDKLLRLQEGMGVKDYVRIPQAGGEGWTSIPNRGLTPERQVYQLGLEDVRERKMAPIIDEQREAKRNMSALQEKFEEAYDTAREDMLEDWQYGVESSAPELEYGFDTDDLDVGSPNTDMRDYWPSDAEDPQRFADEAEDLNARLAEIDDRLDYARSPEYRMMLQTQSPRYRNYQRAMQQRAANKAMGHRLSRMWGDAYNRLRARGLSDEGARRYLGDYFGGRR